MAYSEKTEKPLEVTYWELESEGLILKRITDTLVNQVQVKGTELKKDFSHNWEKVTFPSKERLDEHLRDLGFKPSTVEKYDDLLAKYFQVNDEKREHYNRDRQRRYDEGKLKL